MYSKFLAVLSCETLLIKMREPTSVKGMKSSTFIRTRYDSSTPTALPLWTGRRPATTNASHSLSLTTWALVYRVVDLRSLHSIKPLLAALQFHCDRIVVIRVLNVAYLCLSAFRIRISLGCSERSKSGHPIVCWDCWSFWGSLQRWRAGGCPPGAAAALRLCLRRPWSKVSELKCYGSILSS